MDLSDLGRYADPFDPRSAVFFDGSVIDVVDASLTLSLTDDDPTTLKDPQVLHHRKSGDVREARCQFSDEVGSGAEQFENLAPPWVGQGVPEALNRTSRHAWWHGTRDA